MILFPKNISEPAQFLCVPFFTETARRLGMCIAKTHDREFLLCMFQHLSCTMVYKKYLLLFFSIHTTAMQHISFIRVCISEIFSRPYEKKSRIYKLRTSRCNFSVDTHNIISNRHHSKWKSKSFYLAFW
jgi:hypothetical protein